MQDIDPSLITKVQDLTGKADRDELLNDSPGPGSVEPTTETKTKTPQQQAGLVTLPMKPDEVKEWWSRVRASDTRMAARAEKWDILLENYKPTVRKSSEPQNVKSMMHFRNVHSKMPQLFYQSPELVLTPKDPSPAQNQMPNPMQQFQDPTLPPLPPLTMQDVIAVKQAVLMDKLGREGIKADRLMDELLFDVEAWAGIGCCKVGYRCVTKPYQQPVMQPDPKFVAPPTLDILRLGPQQQAPMVPVLDAMGQPKTETIDVPIHEEYYARRFSPKKLITDLDLKSTRYEEDSTFQGFHFYMSQKRAIRQFKLTPAEAAKTTKDEKVAKYDVDSQGESKTAGRVHGVELWVKASVYTDEVHPLAYCQLVLIEGIEDRPIVWRKSPDQDFDEFGKLTPDSVIGNPIRVLAYRDLADSGFPEADSAFTDAPIRQLTTFRQQSIMLRDCQIGKWLYDQGVFDVTEVAILKDGPVGGFVGVKEGSLAGGLDKVLIHAGGIEGTQTDARTEMMLKQEINETLGVSANQAGTMESTIHSATETATADEAIKSRNNKERSRVTDFYLDLARMVDQFIMRYADQEEYIRVTGTDGAQRMALWLPQMTQGRYLYEIAPDSTNRADTATEFKQDADFYNMAAPDPLFNRSYILRQMARRRGYDPMKIIMDPMQMMTQPPHGGPGAGGAVVNEHIAGRSGNRPNEPGQPNHRENQR